MKKIIVTLLAAAMLLSCVFVLASCGGGQGAKPELDLEEAAENLEDNDYMVNYSDDEDENYNIAEQLYAYNEDGEYLNIVVYKDSKSANIALDSFKAEAEYEKAMIKLQIKYLENILNKYEDDFEDDEEAESIEEEIEELEKELEEFEEEFCYGKSGKTVWKGTKKAVKDSK